MYFSVSIGTTSPEEKTPNPHNLQFIFPMFVNLTVLQDTVTPPTPQFPPAVMGLLSCRHTSVARGASVLISSHHSKTEPTTPSDKRGLWNGTETERMGGGGGGGGGEEGYCSKFDSNP